MNVFTPWLVGLVGVISLSPLCALAAENAGTPSFISNPAGFEIHRGVNLSHWLSQNFGWSPKDTFITDKDIAFIKSIGYDHVRIPIDEKEMWADDGTPRPESFTYLTRALDQCQKAGLRAIVDLHTVRAHHFNAENEGSKNSLFSDAKAQELFLKLWADISEVLAKYPPAFLAYEIMNEPVADEAAQWNALVARAFASLRKWEPNRPIVIGSNRWETAENFPALEVPPGDANIILSVHTYEPLPFTHYKASWLPSKDYLGPVHYPGVTITPADYEHFVDTKNQPLVNILWRARQTFDKQTLRELLKPAIEKARQLHLQLYCGEFGCLPSVDRKDRLAYYSDIISVFEENGLAWANWEYKGDFGIVAYDIPTRKDGPPDRELIHALLDGPGKSR